jgi:hypothetical protein
MFALLQTPPGTIPVHPWVIGVSVTFTMMLIAIIGFLLKFMLSTFKGVVERLEASLTAFVATFQEFKDAAPKEYVTHPFLALVRQELKDDVTNGHRRISEAVTRFEKELSDHRRDCPVRAIRSSPEA